MKKNKIKIESIDPTAIVIDSKSFTIKGLNEYPTRFILTINDNVYMLYNDGQKIDKIK